MNASKDLGGPIPMALLVAAFVVSHELAMFTACSFFERCSIFLASATFWDLHCAIKFISASHVALSKALGRDCDLVTHVYLASQAF